MGDFYASTPVGPFNDAIGASFASFTARQHVDPLPTPKLFPGQLRPGVRLKLEAEGQFSTTATPTLVWGFSLGTIGATGSLTSTVQLAESSAVTLGTATAWPWRMEYRGLVTADGTSGSITGTGTLEYGTSLTAVTTVPLPITLALRTVTINTTIYQGVGVVATYSASSASNAIVVYNCTAILQN